MHFRPATRLHWPRMRRQLDNWASHKLEKPGIVLVFGDVAYEQQPLLDGITSVLGFDVPMIGCSSFGAGLHRIGRPDTRRGCHAKYGAAQEPLSCFPIKASQLQHDCVGRAGPEPWTTGAGRVARGTRADHERREDPRTLRDDSALLVVVFCGWPGVCSADSALVNDGAECTWAPQSQVVGSVGSMTLADQFPGQSTGTVYHNGVAYTDTVRGCGLGKPDTFGRGTGAQAAQPQCRPMLVTRTEGNVVYELNGQPASMSSPILLA